MIKVLMGKLNKQEQMYNICRDMEIPRKNKKNAKDHKHCNINECL